MLTKKIYTSYFANYKNIINSIAISLYLPKWYRDKHFIQLSPSKSILYNYKNNIINEEEYEDLYIKLLVSRQLNPQKIADMIPDNSVMLCYEKSDKFCHRHILGKWLSDNINIEIKELSYGKTNSV